MSEPLATDLAGFEPYLEKITPPAHQQAMVDLLNWVHQTFPELVPRLAWNQPRFTAHGTFIIGFSHAKDHLNVALEAAPLDHFRAPIEAAGDHTTKMLWQIAFTAPVNYALLKRAITYNLTTKSETTSFWR